MIRLFTASLAFLFCAFGAAHASSPLSLGELTKRVDALEYQAKAQGVQLPPMPIPDGQPRIEVAQSAGDLAVRVDRLETQMRQYTGQMEEMNFRLRQLQEQLQRFQEDSEFRFQDLEKGKGPGRSSSNQPRQPAPQQFEQLGTPPQTLGNITQDQVPVDSGTSAATSGGIGGGSGPIDLSSMLGGGAAPAGNGGASLGGNAGLTQGQGLGQEPIIDQGMSQSAALTGDPATDYDMAYSLVLQRNYPEAEKAFRQFVQAYAQSDLAPNAHYWIGESLFQQGDYRGSIEIFLDAYSLYPDAQKAPEMLLKTGMALHKINERDAACATYEELLNKFPNASSGVREKVMAEIKSAQC